MSDSANWETSKTYEPEIKAYVHADSDEARMPAGWWIMPGAALGAMCWAGIIYLVFA